MVRRLIYLAVGLNIIDIPSSLQLNTLMFLNLLNLVYIGKAEPNVDRVDRRIELFNDFMVLICFDSALMVTDLAETPEQKFHNSFLMIGIIQLQIMGNMSLIIPSVLRGIILLGKKLKSIFYHCWGQRSKAKKVKL